MLAVVMYGLRFLHRPTVRALVLFCFLAGYWALFSAIIFAESNLSNLILLNRLKLISPALLPMAILGIALSLQGKRRWHMKARILFAIVPLITVGINLSPEHYDLFITNYHTYQLGEHKLLAFSNGPWFTVHILHAQLVAIFSIAIIFQTRRDMSPEHRYRVWLVILAILVPFVGDGIAVHFIEDLRYMQLTPSLILVSALVMIYVLLRKHLIEVVPFARGHILDSTGDIYLIFDMDKNLVDLNAMAKQHLSLSSADIGQNFNTIAEKHPHLRWLLGFTSERPVEWSLGDAWFEVSRHLLEDSLSDRLGTVFAFKNVTFRKKLEVEREQISELKTKLLAVMGHDFQGNLAAGLLIAQSLERNAAQLSTQGIMQAGRNLEKLSVQNIKLVEELLAWSKQSLGRDKADEWVNLHELADNAVSFLSPLVNAKALRIRMECDPSLVLQSDSNSIATILRNLLSNAIKFSESGGTVWIKARQKEGFVDLIVEDQGCGIDRKRIPSLFDMKSEGNTGMGLFLVRTFAERLGGRIRVESQLSRGSLFEVSLPLVQRPERAPT